MLFADARYYFKNSNNTFFVYGDAGTSSAIDDNISKGPMFNLGGGYKFKIGAKTALTGSVGFLDQSIKTTAPIIKDRYYSIAFKVVLLL